MFFPLSRKRAFISQISLYKRHNNLFVYENSPKVSSYLNVYKRANNKAAKNKTERIPAGTFSSLTDPKERRARGSLTVEAALVLPIFLFAVMAILSFTEILRFQIKADNAISQCAKELAIYAYVTENGSGGASGEAMSMISGLAISETYVRGRVTNELTRSYIDSSPVKGGLYFLGSKMLQDERVEINLSYDVMPFFSLSPRAGFLTGTKAVARAFTGYDNSNPVATEVKEEVVFITPNGTAYHKDRGCNYLDLSIERVSKSDAALMRNSEGEIYHVCPLCGSKGASDVVYVTNYGNRYHSSLLCSGLKRTIEAVPISKVGARHACPKCCY